MQRNVKDGISLNAFRIEKGIGNMGVFYDHVEDDGWVVDRDRIVQKALEKVEAKAVAQAESTFELQGLIYDAVEKQLAFFLKQNVQDGKIVRPIDPAQLAHVSLAAYRSLIARRLMKGKATAITEDRQLLIAALMKVQEDVKAKNPEVLNSTHTIPEFAVDVERVEPEEGVDGQ